MISFIVFKRLPKYKMKPCIIVHGGAFNIADIFVDRYKAGTKDAAKAGYEVLMQVKFFISISRVENSSVI